MPTTSHILWMFGGVLIALFVFPLLMSFFNKAGSSN